MRTLRHSQGACERVTEASVSCALAVSFLPVREAANLPRVYTQGVLDARSPAVGARPGEQRDRIASVTVPQPTLVSHFLERADSFFHAAFNLHELNEIEGGRFGHAIGLLAVHSAIALADAVLVANEGSTSAGDELGTAEVRMEQFFAWAFRAFPDVAQLRKVTDARSA